jgi:hypothetical protein
MDPSGHPEVLAHDWLPPVVLGREREVAEAVRRLDPPRPAAPPPWILGVVGPPGAGTSTVARRTAREVADRLRQSSAGCRPRVVCVRTVGLRGTHGVATALLRHLDEGFDGRGFSVTEILAGFLRRVRREGQPTVLVLDDVHLGGPDLGPILRALGSPDRFLPEGEYGLPPTWTLVAGTAEGWASAAASVDERAALGRPVGLSPYPDRALGRIVEDRAARALGRPTSPDLVHRVVESALSDGGGARRAIDLLRRELVGASFRSALGPTSLGPRPRVVEVEFRVVRAIEDAVLNREARVGDVRRREAELAEAQGARPLPPTTLWRRIVRLEHAGYVAREVRPGGVGGTRSVLRLLTPVEEWVTSSRRSDTHRDVVPWSATSSPGGDSGGLGSGVLPGGGRPPSYPAA